MNLNKHLIQSKKCAKNVQIFTMIQIEHCNHMQTFTCYKMSRQIVLTMFYALTTQNLTFQKYDQ